MKLISKIGYIKMRLNKNQLRPRMGDRKAKTWRRFFNQPERGNKTKLQTCAQLIMV